MLLLDFGSAFSMIIPRKLIGILIHMGVILIYMGVTLIHMGVVRLSDPHGCHTDPHGCCTDPRECRTIHMGVVLIYMGVILIHMAVERYLGMWLLDFFQARPQSVRTEKQDSKRGHSQHWLPSGMCALASAVLTVHKSKNVLIAL